LAGLDLLCAFSTVPAPAAPSGGVSPAEARALWSRL